MKEKRKNEKGKDTKKIQLVEWTGKRNGSHFDVPKRKILKKSSALEIQGIPERDEIPW